MSEIVEITLLQLFWNDILLQHVLPFLTLKDCFNLRATSKRCRELVNSYFAIVKDINISPFKTFSGPALNVFVEKCRSIRHINLAYCSWFEDKLLNRLFYNNKHLSYVNLSGCLGLTPACLQSLIFVCKDLKSLKLKNCHWVTVDCIEVLTLHHNLEEIDLTSCWDLGDESLIALIKKFTRLRVLCISNIYSVTNITMFAIAQYSQCLEHLNISGCWRIRDDGMRMVGEYCRNLRSLHIRGCHYITERSLGCLRNRIFIEQFDFSQHHGGLHHPLPIMGLNL